MEFLFGFIIFVLDVIAIVSVLAGSSSVGRKIIWTLVILFLPLLGLILYYLFGRDARDARLSGGTAT